MGHKPIQEMYQRMSHNSFLKSARIIILYGPTAVGKTAFVDALSARLPIAVINMDIGQFYQPLTIGTAKPAWQHHAAPHYLFDILNKPVQYTVYEYRKQVLECIPHIHQQQRIPVLVGGSGFYAKSLLFPPQAPSAVLHEPHQEYSWEILQRIDPKRAAAINPHDTYRIKRALDVWYTTGMQPSMYKPEYCPVAPYHLICLTRDRNELYARIDERVHMMIEQGWIEETRALKGTAWESFLEEKGLIGYRELLHLLDQPYTKAMLSTVIDRIQQATRHYAKRQMTFWRMLEKQCSAAIMNQKSTDKVSSFNLTLESLDLYINRLVQDILAS